MIRTIGEFSACRAMGRRLGGPDNDTLWRALRPEWIRDCAAEAIRIASEESPSAAASARAELSKIFDERLGLALPRALAHELNRHRDSLCASWAWDAWVCREPNAQLKYVALALKVVAAKLESEGHLPPWEQSCCPVCLRAVKEPFWRTTWRSLHPCAPPPCSHLDQWAVPPRRHLGDLAPHVFRYALDVRQLRARVHAKVRGR